MKKKNILIFVCLAAVIGLLICISLNSSFIRTVDSLITPPLYYSEYEGLVTAFNAEVGNNVVLSNPNDGDHLSAITVSDLDNDGAEEAVIFYRESADSNTVKLTVFEGKNDEWKSCGTFDGYGNEVTSLALDDLDGDGSTEIIVIWDYSGINNAKVFSVYRSDTVKIDYKEIKMCSCDVAEIVDMDADDLSEILYISSDNDGKNVSKNANLLKLSSGNITTIGSVKLDSNVGSYVSVKKEKYNSHYPMKVYFDADKNNNMMITEVVYWDSEKETLVAPMYDEKTNSTTITLRYEQIQSADINNDGMIEIPIQAASDTGENDENDESDESNVLPVTNWIYFVGSTPAFYLKTYVCSESGYYINLSSINNQTLIAKSAEDDEYAAVEVCTDSGKVLYTVISVPTDEYSEAKFESYITVLKTTEYTVCAKINEYGSNLGVDEERVRNLVEKMP